VPGTRPRTASLRLHVAGQLVKLQLDALAGPHVLDVRLVDDQHGLEPVGVALEELDTSVIPLDRMEEGTATAHSFSSHRYGIVLAWDTDRFSGADAPTTMADLYDMQRFPGKRCMFGYPEFGATLESALLADGVAPDDMYPLDVDRALAKLDTIKDDIVWWGSGDEAIQFLTSGECDLGIAWTGRLFDAITKDGADLDFTWNGAVYASGWYGIPTNAPNKEAAKAYLAHFIMNQEAQVEFLERFPYPPPIEGLEIPTSVEKWVPLGSNVENAFPEDDEWYSQNIEQLAARFTAWLSE
jgi:putative spermidine/putrescine transport system substrate-binding protein